MSDDDLKIDIVTRLEWLARHGDGPTKRVCKRAIEEILQARLTLMSIGEEVGLDAVTAHNVIDRIRALKQRGRTG